LLSSWSSGNELNRDCFNGRFAFLVVVVIAQLPGLVSTYGVNVEWGCGKVWSQTAIFFVLIVVVVGSSEP
jgi:hypothetical protein